MGPVSLENEKWLSSSGINSRHVPTVWQFLWRCIVIGIIPHPTHSLGVVINFGFFFPEKIHRSVYVSECLHYWARIPQDIIDKLFLFFCFVLYLFRVLCFIYVLFLFYKEWLWQRFWIMTKRRSNCVVHAVFVLVSNELVLMKNSKILTGVEILIQCVHFTKTL